MTNQDLKAEVVKFVENSDKDSTPEKKESTNSISNMQFEEIRLNSFSTWPAYYPVNSSRLAKSGFFYTGNEDEVECFSCNGRISHWQFGDIVHKKHKELFPHCKFISNESNNVPLINNNAALKAESSQTKTDFQNVSVNGKLSISNENFCQHNSDASDIEKSNSEDVLFKSTTDFNMLALENERLKTFTTTWPLPFLSVQELSKAGFFYLGYGDKVQCAFCHVIISNWEESDIPIIEHSRHSSLCPFLKEYTNNKNYSSPSEKNTITYKKPSTSCIETEDFYKLIDKSKHHTRLEELGVRLHKTPIHPQQATYQARLRSYDSWPDHFPVKIENLAAAGFFYIGLDDHTKCFNCDGGLCSWEEGDDPWIEHARWFRNCSFVLLNKGDEFIKTCVKNHVKLEVGEVDGMSPESSSNYTFSNDELFVKVNQCMNSHLIKAILKTEVFPAFLIREAVVKQFQEHGSPFSNTDEVCEAVHQLKEKLQISDNESNMPIRKTSLVSEENNVPLSKDSSNFNEKIDIKKGDENLKVQNECKVCFDHEATVVFLPCGHLIACTFCALALNVCPYCRECIQATVRAFVPV